MNKKLAFTFLLIFISITASYSQIKLPKLISDGIIFQRNTEIEIWGWAAPNEEIKLTFKKETYNTKADTSGNWKINFPAQKAGGPFNMVFEASNKIELKNILFGDVWVCSGQSNMELTMDRVKEKYATIVSNYENENIRQFLVPDKYDFKTEHNDLNGGNWQSINSKSILNFSAVAFFFAKDLYERYQVPIGLINAALGGSPVEAWMSENSLKKFPNSFNELQKFKNDSIIKSIEESDKTRSNNWYSELNKKDKGLQEIPNWNEIFVKDTNWNSIEIPSFVPNNSKENINGVYWFRKEINVPKSMVGKPAKLWLGRIVDQDYVYLNGDFIGTTGYQYPPRRYSVKETVLKEGKNTIAVRLINNAGKGGFILDKPYYLAVGKDTIDLKGTWKYKLGAAMKPLEGPTFIRWKPAGLYNKMIAPLFKFPIKGVIWYQGESNTANTNNYAEKFEEMIQNWRQRWNQGNFPFIFVQLANFMEETQTPVESNWAALRQEQLKALELPNTGMTVIIDLGEWNDIHPLNKEDVGKRLALEARKLSYGEKTLASSPIPSRAKFGSKKAVISFKNVGKGLISKNKAALKYFSISNNGIDFEWAKAKIKGSKIKVWNKKIKNPTVVRYAWSNNPFMPNLYNKNGLPASPFEIKKE